MHGDRTAGDRMAVIDRLKRSYPVPFQLAAVLVGTVLVLVSAGWLVMWGFWIGSQALVVIGLVPAFGLYFLVGTVTREGSPLTRTPGWRVLWAALVTALALLGVVF